jgi:uridine phosphorylase
MSNIYNSHSFKKDLLLADRGVPKALVLIGASDSQSAFKQIKKAIQIKKVQETVFPSVYTGFVKNKLIAFGSTYATSLTADIVNSYTEIGVRKIALFGFCGALKKEWKRGDIISPAIIYDGVGIFKAYEISKKQIKIKEAGPSEYVTSVLTWHNLFSETAKLIRSWQNQNFDCVDLESSAVIAVCKKRNIIPHLQLVVADQLYKNDHLQKTYKTSFTELCLKRKQLIRDYINVIIRA